MIGTLLDGRYQIVRRLGDGGMGTVYEAHHRGTGRAVAIKVLAEPDLDVNGDMLARFQREAHAAGRIESEHIAQVFDAGCDPNLGLPFIAMELLVGCDLRQVLGAIGPLPVDLVLRIGAQACLGLERAHEAGIVHRDIKPANLFLAYQRDGTTTVKLLDFGIAKLPVDMQWRGRPSALTATGQLLGSPLYMSPEQAQGLKTLDHRTDIWSLGTVLYEALSGHTPLAHFETVGQLIVALCSQPVRDLQEVAPWVPLEVARIIHRALRIDPAERFASPHAFYEELRSLLPGRIRIEDRDWEHLEGALDSSAERAKDGASAGHLTLRALRGIASEPPRLPPASHRPIGATGAAAGPSSADDTLPSAHNDFLLSPHPGEGSSAQLGSVKRPDPISSGGSVARSASRPREGASDREGAAGRGRRRAAVAGVVVVGAVLLGVEMWSASRVRAVPAGHPEFIGIASSPNVGIGAPGQAAASPPLGGVAAAGVLTASVTTDGSVDSSAVSEVAPPASATSRGVVQAHGLPKPPPQRTPQPLLSAHAMAIPAIAESSALSFPASPSASASSRPSRFSTLNRTFE